MEFYDQLANFYHLIYSNWDETIDRQGQQLSDVIESEWPRSHTVLDVSCGIGTQSIGLAKCGLEVTASDISEGAIRRAETEASRLNVEVTFSVCDMRQAYSHHGSGFDVVISCDNSLPHLLTDQDLLTALENMLACLSPGGGCVISVRDYEREERGRGLVKLHGVRRSNGFRYLLFQVWDFEGEHYDLTFYIVEEDDTTQETRTHVLRSRYYAISTDHLCDLMSAAGFRDVKRVDQAYFQSLLVGTRAA